MRTYELLLVLISFISLIISFIRNESKNQKIITTILILIIFGLHFFYESIRWQMYGTYYLLLFLLITLFFPLKKSWRKNLFFVINLLVVVVTIVLLLVFRVNSIPELTGEYNVGTITYDLVDESRLELYGENTDINRKIRVQAWYPTDDATGELVPWITDGKFVAEQIPAFVNMPSFLLDYITVIDSNSFKDASLSTKIDKMPVIILSHGWSSFRSLHTDFAEMLASNGYLVIGIDHTYGAMGTVFEDGTEAKIDLNALPSFDDNNEFLKYANILVNTYSLDSKLVIDDIAKLNSGQSPITKFIDKIDTNEIGVIGHSTGGGGVVELAIEDSRVKAVFGLDPWVEPLTEDVISKGLNIPAIFFRSEQWSDGPNNINLKTIAENSGDNLSIYQINGSIHQDFTMLYMFNPTGKYLGMSSHVDSDLNREIQSNYLLGFFNKNLKGMDTDVDDLVNKYDVVVKIDF